MRQPAVLPVLLAFVLTSAAATAAPLSITSLEGTEAISSLFRFELELAGPPLAFDALLGKEVTVSIPLPGGATRHYSGLVSRFSAGTVDHIDIVPKLWLLTRTADNRVFQDLSVPEILERVLGESDISFQFKLVGEFPPRPYVVQRNETDFTFISRLMEEEGIFYFFTHSATGHELVIANTPQAHPASAGSPARWTGANVKPQRVHEWTKTQEIRSGKVTLADHAFELPHQPFTFTELIQESVAAGRVTHRLRLPVSEALEVYDFPGGYAGRFDGVDAVNPSTIEDEGLRAVEIRAQEEAAQALVIQGGSDLGQLTSGHKFTLAGHFDADGEYVLTSVRHSARLRKGRGAGFDYQNSFTCIPAGLPFRPARVTPRPHLGGLETAFVTGPAGSEIHTDKYGRVKVQFHWDREGQHDDKSSVWIRVSQLPAPPRVGDEVVVAFMHGDPDRPVIVGSVWNPLTPPPPR